MNLAVLLDSASRSFPFTALSIVCASTGWCCVDTFSTPCHTSVTQPWLSG